MRIHIQAIQFTAAEPLTEYIERKVGKLTHYFDRIIDAEVYLSLNSKSSAIKDKVLKVKLNLPGTQLIATDTAKTFEEALDIVVENLKRQVTRHKEKVQP